MTGPMIDRRMALLATGAAFASARLPAAPGNAPQRSHAKIFLFDPRSAEARAMARRTQGKRLIALKGDPMRLWRDIVARGRQSVEGVTRWSDFVLLRELARDSGMRVISEEHKPATEQALLVRWTIA